MSPTERLSKVADALTGGQTVQEPNDLPWNPDATRFPSRKELPRIPGAPDDAAWVWGKDDQIGRLNLLTPARVKAAAGEIKTGEMVRLDLPLNVPKAPAFGREVFEHKIKPLGSGVGYDDLYTLNTQSGTQWDGFRHFAHLGSKYFYNGATSTDIEGANPTTRCSIHHWAKHCIAGRAVLLDYKAYAESHNKDYDPYTSHAISYSDLTSCAAHQGIDIRPYSAGGGIRPGDILLVRSGFVQRYTELSPSQRAAAAARTGTDIAWAGLKQEESILDWLHDCYFAAVAGDSPTFECWPVTATEGGRGKIGFMHQNILALWGMPLGEMWDLEGVSEVCRRQNRWTFFLTSAPANVVGGVSSHPNATAIF
ncbi:uncharacterized protein DSM5745_06643 [Aspergillus mulundensis]|uniref:Cyclase n=1 Tax=Aspergillus mulundensis TaxID=1810919 RepID=A0A3D8RS53_9EURO|nr:Uncharacterized protein DSM5745_06643 [Aspergillus mulundensis]RDW76651.1 Uncharacterized protein DSM5745_06643 [Aspergillus mulundensis]